jgi:hypothetical protein
MITTGLQIPDRSLKADPCRLVPGSRSRLLDHDINRR